MASIRRLDYPDSAYEVVTTRGTNPSAGRNQGARLARGEILAFLDDDATIPPDYLLEAEAFFREYPEIDIVGGPQLTATDDQGFSRISWYALSSMFGAWKVSRRYALREIRLNADETAVSSANLLCRKRVLDTVAFDTTLFPGEDPKFIADAIRAGFRIAYSPAIRLYHRRRATVPALMRQIFSYGKARPRKETLLETLRMPFFFVPSLFLLYLIGLGAVTAVQPWIVGEALSFGGGLTNEPMPGKLLFLPLLIYAAAAVLFGIYDSARNRDLKAVFVLPFMYPLIHLSYGLGMIRGYADRLRFIPGIKSRKPSGLI
ncbi:MAG: glycosyltransferase [Thermodesulfobacteriota bacterium]